MADSQLQISLYPVRNLALVPNACMCSYNTFVYQRATNARSIVTQKRLAQYDLHASLTIQSIWGVAVISSIVSQR